jgi:Transglycosylase SLT domain
MDVVKRLIAPWSAGLLCVCSSVAWSSSVVAYCGTTRWAAYIDEAATRFELSPRWLDAVIRAESAGCDVIDGRPTTSAAGAMGLMQIMPATWERLRQRLNLGSDAYDPHDNILAGAAYLRELYDRYGWPGASAAYHAGPARYDEYLKAARPLPGATFDYLARIDRALARGSTESNAPGSESASPTHANRELFVGRTLSDATTDVESGHSPSDGLFVSLRHAKRREERKTPESSDVQHQ